jgi:hypothetical protein
MTFGGKTVGSGNSCFFFWLFNAQLLNFLQSFHFPCSLSPHADSLIVYGLFERHTKLVLFFKEKKVVLLLADQGFLRLKDMSPSYQDHYHSFPFES